MLLFAGEMTGVPRMPARALFASVTATAPKVWRTQRPQMPAWQYAFSSREHNVTLVVPLIWWSWTY